VSEDGAGRATSGSTPPASRPVQVLISYAHDSKAHEEAVRDLWVFLRANGIDAQLDRVAAQRRQDWSLWMMDQVPGCRSHPGDRVRGLQAPRGGPDSTGRGPGRPVRGATHPGCGLPGPAGAGPVRAGGAARWFGGRHPDFLTPATSTVYHVSELTVAGAEGLLRLVTGQAAEVEPPLGQVPVLGARGQATPVPPVLRHDVAMHVALAQTGG